MQYFKNVELARLYPVSESAVRKWIEGARQGKIDLLLHEHNGKWHVANTTKNLRTIEELVERGQKYKNTRSKKTVTPKPGFYELYSKKQILDIISNVEVNREIPLQYSYFNGGVDYWDNFTNRLWQEKDGNILTATISLLSNNIGNITSLLRGYEKVNVIDLGVGNGLPVKELLSHLLYETGSLGRYIGIDISGEMLDVAEENINTWFEGRVTFERYERDFTFERFDDLFVEETLTHGVGRTINLVLLFGGTLENFNYPEEVLRVIRRSMGRNDLLLNSAKLDSDEARRYFDFATEEGLPRLAKNHRLLLDLLNIDDSYYEVEKGYDDYNRARYIRVKLKVDLTINFTFDTGERRVELHKDDIILVWRARHLTTVEIIDQFHRNGFEPVQVSATKDHHYLLTISEVSTPSAIR